MLREEKADKNFHVINRQRYHFVYNEHPYNIDVYNNLYGREKTYILRFANPRKQDSKALFPDFLVAIEDVRLDQRYSLKNIAKI